MKWFVLFMLGAILFFGGCDGGSSSGSNNSKDNSNGGGNVNWYKPSLDTTWQWQLNGNINTSYDVDIYDIDLFDTNLSTIKELHDEGKKVICYFSAGSYEDWRDDANKFPSEVLGKDMDGWDGEKWLDIGNIELLRSIMLARLDLAKQKGCDGVEPDNMDGYVNDTGFSISADEQIIYNKFIATQAHKRGLSVALKNDLDQISVLEPYFDFALNEQCNYYNECSKLQPFIDSGKPVFNAEYNSKYIVDNEANITLCNAMNDIGFQTLVLPIDLNDSFRYSCNVKDKMINSFGVGYGGGSSFKFQDDSNNSIWVSSVDLMLDENISSNETYKDIKNFDANMFNRLQQHLKKARFFTMWVTKGWQESWFDLQKINDAIENGKIPVFVYWYFGDSLVNGMPNDTQIDEYMADNQKFRTFLDKVDGYKLVIMEPEFNKQSVLDNQEQFIKIMSDAIDKIKDDTTAISLCMTDTGNRGVNQTYEKCGYTNCSLGDKYEWGLSKPIYKALLSKLDFISFQEMLGQFSRDPSDPGTWDEPNPKAYTDDEIGIVYLPKRLENMASFLYDTYKKPIYLPYITVATATWDDKNGDESITTDEINTTGYEAKVSKMYQDINKTALKNNHLFGYSVIELFDEPKHDSGGYQFFMNNEYHLGIIKSSAVDDNDSAINGDIEFKGDILDFVF